MSQWETNLDKIAARALAIWTNDGQDFYDDLIEDINQDELWQARCNVINVVANAYGSDMTNDEWLAATLARLREISGK